jgi:hypothetical protein
MLQHVLAYDLHRNAYTGVITVMDPFANVVVLYNAEQGVFAKCLYTEIYHDPKYKEGGLHPFDTQEGGNHYKQMAIQPTDYILRNGLGFCEGNVVKYVTRHPFKNGIEDVKKAKHYCEILIADLERQEKETEKMEVGENFDKQCGCAVSCGSEDCASGGLVDEIADSLDIDEFANTIAPHAINDAGIVTTGVDDEGPADMPREWSEKEEVDALLDSYKEYQGNCPRAMASLDMQEEGWGDIMPEPTRLYRCKTTTAPNPFMEGDYVRLADYIACLSPAFYGQNGTVTHVEGKVVWVKVDGYEKSSLPIGFTDLTPIRRAFMESRSAA